MAQSSTLKSAFAILTLAFVSPLALAHSGHDHSVLSAWFIHLLWIGPVALAAGYIALCIHRANRVKPNNNFHKPSD